MSCQSVGDGTQPAVSKLQSAGLHETRKARERCARPRSLSQAWNKWEKDCVLRWSDRARTAMSWYEDKMCVVELLHKETGSRGYRLRQIHTNSRAIQKE